MFAKSEDPDEMPQNTTLRQGLHCLVRKQMDLLKINIIILKLYNRPSSFKYIKLYKNIIGLKKVNVQSGLKFKLRK